MGTLLRGSKLGSDWRRLLPTACWPAAGCALCRCIALWCAIMSCGCLRAQKACLERYRSASREIIALLHKTAPQVQPPPPI